MKVVKYEIDFLDVKDADAILIHFWDEVTGRDYVMAIDAGRYGDGDTISNFIKTRYNKNEIDIAVVTHCDDDHYGGFVRILEKQAEAKENIGIREFWINNPGDYVSADKYKYFKKNSNLKNEVRCVYDVDKDQNLLDLIEELGISKKTALSHGGDFCKYEDGLFEILGPTKNYYKSLVPTLRHNAEAYDVDNIDVNDSMDGEGECLSPAMDKATDDTSTHNASSVILMFKPSDGRKFIFMGDASRASYDNMLSCDQEKMSNATLLKVPHHGSIHNLCSKIINLINPQFAIVCARSVEKYFSHRVKYALKKKGAGVYSTHYHGSLWFHVNVDKRSDYDSSDSM